MDTYKKINITLIGVSTIVGVGLSVYLDPQCTPVNCRNGSLEAIIQILSGLFVFAGIVFLVLPVEYFKVWLKYILSWIIPLGFLFALNAESFAGSWMPFHPINAVELIVYFTFFVTVVSILGRFLWLRRKDKLIGGIK